MAAVIALHGLLLAHFLPLSQVVRDVPMTGDDYDTHLGQTYRLIRALDEAGQHYGYFPELLAGFPGGAIFDADNKGWSYFVYLLWRGLDMSPARAFNLFVWLSMAAPPLLVFLAARLWKFGSRAAVWAAFSASMLWWFDSFVHWCWWVGMVAYAGGAVAALVPLGLYYRVFDRAASPLRRSAWSAAAAVALALVLMVHPYTFFVLAVPMGVLYLRDLRTHPPLVHVATLGIAAVACLWNLPWLSVSLAHWHLILDSAYFAQGGPSFLVADFFNTLISPTDTGVLGTRASFRFLFLALACLGLSRLRAARDDRFGPLALGLGWLFCLAYLGPILPGAGQVQPYRHVLPLGFIAILPAASLVETLDWRGGLRTLGAGWLPVLAVVAVLAGQRLLDDALYFLPGWRPRVAPLIDGTPSPLAAAGYALPPSYRLPHRPGTHAGVDPLVAWASETLGRGGRLLVEETVLGERMAWRARLEVLGGFRLRNLEHSKANLFRTHQGRVISPATLRRHVQTYAVDYIVARREHPEFDHMPELLEREPDRHGRRLYRVVIPHRKIRPGPGHVSARMNRIAVRGSDPETTLTLAYHHHPRLVCEPDCQVLREPVEGDAVGLIRVPAPHPSDFLLRIRY